MPPDDMHLDSRAHVNATILYARENAVTCRTLPKKLIWDPTWCFVTVYHMVYHMIFYIFFHTHSEAYIDNISQKTLLERLEMNSYMKHTFFGARTKYMCMWLIQ